MTDSTKQPRTKGLFLPPLFQLILSGIGLSISLLLGALFILGGVFGLIEQSLSSELLTFFSMGWSAFLVGGLFLPPLVQSVQQLTGKETHFSQKSNFRAASILMVLWVPLLLLGQWIANSEFLPWLFLPPLQTILMATPIFFLIELARRKLNFPEGGASGVYSFGVVLTQPLVLLVEMVSLVGVSIVVIGWISTQPAWMDEITRLSQRLMNAQIDPQVLKQIVLPYLQKPAVMIAVLAIGAGFIPLLEELMKPLALWVMVGRKLDESAGFVLGLFAGGTFALLESLGMVVSATGQDWSSIIVARLGTGILHITTTAVLGWGLAAARKNRKYVQLGLTFLVSFTLHAVWNMLGIYLGIQEYLPADTNPVLKSAGSIALGLLAAVMVLILLVANRRFRKEQTRDDSTVLIVDGIDMGE